MPLLTLIRGLPGSGKSTLAKQICSITKALHLEADMFFVRKEKYMFNLKQIGLAHKWCLSKTEETLSKGKDVVVSNTFVKFADLRPYFNIASKTGASVNLLEAKGQYKSIHDIPQDKFDEMKANWEQSPKS